MTMYIELLGGPNDGTVLVVPDDTKIWVTRYQVLHPAQLAGADLVSDTTVPFEEHAYMETSSRNLTNGAILFRHAGVRQHS